MAEVNEQTIVCTFEKDRDTPNAVKFNEVHSEGRPPVSNLYVTKEWLSKIGNPTQLTVTVAAG